MGGRYGDGDVLVVAVAAPAVDGRATEAVADAVAAAFGLRRREVEVVSGATSRTKTLRLHGDGAALRVRLAGLLDGAG